MTDCLAAFATAAQLDERYRGDLAVAELLDRILNRMPSALPKVSLRLPIHAMLPRAHYVFLIRAKW